MPRGSDPGCSSGRSAPTRPAQAQAQAQAPGGLAQHQRLLELEMTSPRPACRIELANAAQASSRYYPDSAGRRWHRRPLAGPATGPARRSSARGRTPVRSAPGVAGPDRPRSPPETRQRRAGDCRQQRWQPFADFVLHPRCMGLQCLLEPRGLLAQRQRADLGRNSLERVRGPVASSQREASIASP